MLDVSKKINSESEFPHRCYCFCPSHHHNSPGLKASTLVLHAPPYSNEGCVFVKIKSIILPHTKSCNTQLLANYHPSDFISHHSPLALISQRSQSHSSLWLLDWLFLVPGILSPRIACMAPSLTS